MFLQELKRIKDLLRLAYLVRHVLLLSVVFFSALTGGSAVDTLFLIRITTMATQGNPLSTIPAEVPVGVVGLGLMGSSIVTCLLLAGHPVIGIAPLPADLETAPTRIQENLAQASEQEICTEKPDYYFKNLTITEDYHLLKDTLIVIECTLED